MAIRNTITLLILLVTVLLSNAQNVGIGTPTPTEKLDVNGNVNIAGTIKTNGAAGASGQVLTSTGAGMQWTNLGDTYSHWATFNATGASTWTVPDSVKTIVVEVWGAGGGGNGGMGGGSGAYIRALLDVSAGNVLQITVGAGGAGATTREGTGGKGGYSQVQVNGGYVYAEGGYASSSYSQTYFYAFVNTGAATASMGGFVPVKRSYIVMQGNIGKPTQYAFFPSAVSTYRDIHFGNGGNAPAWSEPTGGIGDYELTDNATGHDVTVVRGSSAKQPGGGGACRYYAGGYDGGNGLVIIWY